MPLVRTIEDAELSEFAASFLTTLAELADKAEQAGRADVGLLAADALAAVEPLYDVLVRRPLGPAPAGGAD